jgi:hypothetical protein
MKKQKTQNTRLANLIFALRPKENKLNKFATNWLEYGIDSFAGKLAKEIKPMF